MKNLFALLIVFLFSVNESSGNHLSAQVSFGVKGSLTNSWMNYGDATDGTQSDIRGEIGGDSFSILSYYKLTDHFSIGLEPGYTARGGAFVPAFGWLSEWQMELHYIELPILASYSQGLLKNKLFLTGKLGYNVAYLAKSTTVNAGDETADFILAPLDFSQPIEDWDHGLQTGVSISYLINSFELFSELSYYHGLVDVYRFSSTNSKNRVTNLSFGVLYNLGKS